MVKAFGQRFRSFSACCKAHNINLSTVQFRMKQKGMTLEQALKPEPIRAILVVTETMREKHRAWV